MTNNPSSSPEPETPHDDPLPDLNPWEANDPRGLSGRPDAEPTPQNLAIWRYIILAIIAVNFFLYFVNPAVNEKLPLFFVLFPLMPLVFTTRRFVCKVTQTMPAPNELGTVTWQKLYNAFRVFFSRFSWNDCGLFAHTQFTDTSTKRRNFDSADDLWRD